MPVVRMQPRNNEMVLIREVRDSAGRTDAQVEAMERNDPRPPKVRGTDLLYAQQISIEQANYPKVMYKLAVKYPKGADGKPNKDAEPILKGDRINPNYPMPYNLAIEAGFQGQVTGHGSDKGINIVHPFITCFVPIGWEPNFPVPIDEKECKKDENELIKEGWKHSPSELALPVAVAEVD